MDRRQTGPKKSRKKSGNQDRRSRQPEHAGTVYSLGMIVVTALLLSLNLSLSLSLSFSRASRHWQVRLDEANPYAAISHAMDAQPLGGLDLIAGVAV